MDKKALSSITVLLLTIIVIGNVSEVSAYGLYLEKIETPGLGFTKDSFFYNLNYFINYYNAISANEGVNVSITQYEQYHVLGWRTDDGWIRGFGNGQGIVGVAGPKDNVEEVYFEIEEQIFDVNHSDPLIIKKDLALDNFLLAFENCIFDTHSENSTLMNKARIWISQQRDVLNLYEYNPNVTIGDKILRAAVDFNFTGNTRLLGIFISGVPKSPEGPAWWVYYSVIGTTLGIISFSAAATRLYNRSKNKKV